ncbi:hypothetical protein ASU85_10710 [Klebsiella aerogenes]|uniref:phage tail assembly chaperone n=1 Tax=Klebsiella aerogenes TaxID=548 RepID=UPI000735D9C9|nr:hypothetical protein [Klebsiella aerogenes]KTJ34657.1 hypothetical protein ASU85_10710 [Klebsiella aerogenes]
MEMHTFNVGEKEFSAAKMNAFSAAKHLVKLKTLLDKGLAQGTEANAIALLSGVDEKTLETVIMPIMRDAMAACVTDGVKLDSEQNINRVFTADTLFDLFQVIWEVLKLNFAPFFTQILSLFGLSPEELSSRVKALASKSAQAN